MSETVLHPRAFQTGVANARAIIRAPKGDFTDDEIAGACDFLMSFGDEHDYLTGKMVMQAVNQRTINEMNRRAIRNLRWLTIRDAIIITASVWIAAVVLFALVTR